MQLLKYAQLMIDVEFGTVEAIVKVLNRSKIISILIISINMCAIISLIMKNVFDKNKLENIEEAWIWIVSTLFIMVFILNGITFGFYYKMCAWFIEILIDNKR